MALPPDLQSTVCCWRGCDATFEGKGKPEGWVNLLTWASQQSDLDRTIGEIVFGPYQTRHTVLARPEGAALMNGARPRMVLVRSELSLRVLILQDRQRPLLRWSDG